jgi:hypothetical protein
MVFGMSSMCMFALMCALQEPELALPGCCQVDENILAPKIGAFQIGPKTQNVNFFQRLLLWF